MNKFLLTLGLLNLLGLIVLGSFYLSNRQELVYVDSARLVNGYQGMIDARKNYQKKTVQWKANIDTLTVEVQRAIMDYEKGSSKMTVREKKLSEELIRAKQGQLMQYQQAMKAQAQQEDSKMTSEVLTQVNAYIRKYGMAHGYTIILAATEYGNIAYANEALDITSIILEGLNKEYKGQ
ncbi:MAG: OmpH family outer membrane protein [Cyclobacteriaceae bacterium]|nr:OmpH family outer membrane protein [Cyclobacteriaceae bacterium]